MFGKCILCSVLVIVRMNSVSTCATRVVECANSSNDYVFSTSVCENEFYWLLLELITKRLWNSCNMASAGNQESMCVLYVEQGLLLQCSLALLAM